MKTRGGFWSDFPPLSFGIFFWVITSISKPDGSGWKRRLWPCFSWYGALILWPWWSVMAILMEQDLVRRREVVWRKARPAIANTRLELWGCPLLSYTFISLGISPTHITIIGSKLKFTIKNFPWKYLSLGPAA